VELTLGAEERHGEVRGVAAREQRLARRAAPRRRRPRDGDGARELDHGPGRPGVGRPSRALDLRRARACGRGDTSSSPSSSRISEASRAENDRRLLDHLVEHRCGLQLAREEAAGVGQLLGEATSNRRSTFEELTADERRLRAIRKLPREIESSSVKARARGRGRGQSRAARGAAGRAGIARSDAAPAASRNDWPKRSSPASAVEAIVSPAEAARSSNLRARPVNRRANAARRVSGRL
jgi:hypothetical protein